MGANEKREATYHGGERTPATEEVEDSYTMDQVQTSLRKSTVVAREEFRRWLETVRAEAKAEALNEMAKELESQIAGFTRETPQTRAGKDIIRLIRARANQYKEQS